MTAPVPPLELRRPMAHDEAGAAAIDAAMKAALKGDFSELDKLEIDYLNRLVRIGELVVKHPDGRRHWWFDRPDDERYQTGVLETHAPFVIGIVRGYTADARSALEWALYEKCRQCAGRLRRMPCRVCDGRWYLDDMNDHELVYTDIDGVLLKEVT